MKISLNRIVVFNIKNYIKYYIYNAIKIHYIFNLSSSFNVYQ